MSALPSGISRVPNLLASQLTLRQISGTNVSLLKLQEQLSSFKRINRPSDDPVASTLLDKINSDLATSTQRARNFDNASSTLNTMDQVIGQLSDQVLNAKSVASSQVGAGSDSATRAQQASVIDSIINGVTAGLNRDYTGIHLFAGSSTASAPIQYFNGGYRYAGGGDGLRTDLGEGIDFPITLGADAVAGAQSAQVKSTVDLNPRLTPSTNLSDLRGPITGKQLGTMDITITTGGVPMVVTADLSHAATIGDVANIVESAIRTASPGALAGAYPGGVSVNSDRLGVNVAAAGTTITFSDSASGSTATALGLSNFTYDNLNPNNPSAGADLNPVVTDATTFGDLFAGAGASTGDVLFRVGSYSGTVTTTPGMTLGDFKEAVRRLNIGARVEIDASGNTINAFNEVSGLRMSIEEGATGGNAATALGIRTLMTSTAASSLNDGRGVQIADGVINPLTGAPDPAKNVDFQITLSTGATFNVDLVPGDLASMQGILNRINASAAAAGISVGAGPGQFNAALTRTGNGIALQDTLGGAAALKVTSLNGHAAEDLGLLDGASTAGNPAVLAGSDRSSVRVDGLLSTLIDLRNALSADDSAGITLAGSRLEDEVQRLATARATVGSRAQRIEDETTNLQSRDTLNKSIKSKLQDLDVVQASGSLSLLQTQLQAGLTAAGQTRQLTLLNFLQ